jgi:hypothetical protein
LAEVQQRPGQFGLADDAPLAYYFVDVALEQLEGAVGALAIPEGLFILADRVPQSHLDEAGAPEDVVKVGTLVGADLVGPHEIQGESFKF